MENFQENNPAPEKKPEWRDEPPPRSLTRAYEVLYPRPGRPVQGIILGEQPVGVMLHWDGSRTLPCVRGECNRPHTPRDPYWHGYLPLAVRDAVVPVVLGVSAEAWRQLAGLRAVHGGLRGLRVRLAREKANRGPVGVNLLSEDRVIKAPPWFDVRPFLMDLWFPETLRLGGRGPVEEQEAVAHGRLARLLNGLFTLSGDSKGGEE